VPVPVEPPIRFEATRSYAYNAARYELLPRLAEIARKKYGDEPFLLRELSNRLLGETYSAEQLEIRVKKAQSDATDSMRSILNWYIRFLALEKLDIFENLGGGRVKAPSIDDELAEADAVATDVDSNDPGFVYAYSFPSIISRVGCLSRSHLHNKNHVSPQSLPQVCRRLNRNHQK
jgi:hypothetical protein